jgi:hypothetical protein
MLCERWRLRSENNHLNGKLTNSTTDSNWLWPTLGCLLTALLILAQCCILKTACAFVCSIVCISICLPCLWAIFLFRICKNTVKVLLVKSKVNTLWLLLNFKSAEDCGTTTGRRLALSLSVGRFLNLLSFRDVTLGWLFIIPNFTTSLSWSFWPGISTFTFIDVDFWAVNFPSMNVRVLKCHYLSFVSPWSEVGGLRGGFGCGLVVQLSVSKAVVHLYVLWRRSLRWVSRSTWSGWLVLLKVSFEYFEWWLLIWKRVLDF